jgi:hypothetical protein
MIAAGIVLDISAAVIIWIGIRIAASAGWLADYAPSLTQ